MREIGKPRARIIPTRRRIDVPRLAVTAQLDRAMTLFMLLLPMARSSRAMTNWAAECQRRPWGAAMRLTDCSMALSLVASIRWLARDCYLLSLVTGADLVADEAGGGGFAPAGTGTLRVVRGMLLSLSCSRRSALPDLVEVISWVPSGQCS